MKLTPMLLITLVFSISLFSCGNESNKESSKKPQWVLSSKKFYRYAYTPTGKIDTTYILHMNYKNAQKTDSSSFFIKSIYNGDRLIENRSFRNNTMNNSTPESLAFSKFEFDNAGRMTKSTTYHKNILYKQETYTFDTSGRLISYGGIISNASKDFSDSEDEDLTRLHSNVNPVYDTLYVKYEYDNNNRVVRSVATDNSGKVIRTDINIYSGEAPLAAYSIDSKGDTSQKMTFQPEGKFLKTITTNDTLILTRIVANGKVPLAQVTEHKNTKKMYRRVYNYGNKGIAEMSFYILE